MYESISKNNELENEMTLDMSYFWYSDVLVVGYDFCPPQDAFVAPWFEVTVYFIGPWCINIGQCILTLHAFTCVDTVVEYQYKMMK